MVGRKVTPFSTQYDANKPLTQGVKLKFQKAYKALEGIAGEDPLSFVKAFVLRSDFTKEFAKSGLVDKKLKMHTKLVEEELKKELELINQKSKREDRLFKHKMTQLMSEVYGGYKKIKKYTGIRISQPLLEGSRKNKGKKGVTELHGKPGRKPTDAVKFVPSLREHHDQPSISEAAARRTVNVKQANGARVPVAVKELVVSERTALCSYPNLKKRVKGGQGKSEPGKASYSALRNLKKRNMSEFRPAKQTKMYCSDCKRRNKNIRWFNTRFEKANMRTLDVLDSRPADQFLPEEKAIVHRIKVSKYYVRWTSQTEKTIRSRLRELRVDQNHYSIKTKLVKVRKDISANLVSGTMLSVVDWAEKLDQGRKKHMTEKTERDLSKISVWGDYMEFFEDGEKKRVGVIILSQYLDHDAFASVAMKKHTVENIPRIKKAYENTKIHHQFSDCGKHLNGQEWANYPLDELMETFPGLTKSFLHNFCEKHGKDAADLLFSLISRAHKLLENTPKGCNDLEETRAFLEDKIREWRHSNEVTGFAENPIEIIVMIWPKPGDEKPKRPEKRCLICIPNTDSSYCKSARRDSENDVKIYEHVFFEHEGKLGNQIDSNHTFMMKYKKRDFKTSPNIEKDEDEGACGCERQEARARARISMIAKLNREPADLHFGTNVARKRAKLCKKRKRSTSKKLPSVSKKRKSQPSSSKRTTQVGKLPKKRKRSTKRTTQPKKRKYKKNRRPWTQNRIYETVLYCAGATGQQRKKRDGGGLPFPTPTSWRGTEFHGAFQRFGTKGFQTREEVANICNLKLKKK